MYLHVTFIQTKKNLYKLSVMISVAEYQQKTNVIKLLLSTSPHRYHYVVDIQRLRNTNICLLQRGPQKYLIYFWKKSTSSRLVYRLVTKNRLLFKPYPNAVYCVRSSVAYDVDFLGQITKKTSDSIKKNEWNHASSTAIVVISRYSEFSEGVFECQCQLRFWKNQFV